MVWCLFSFVCTNVRSPNPSVCFGVCFCVSWGRSRKASLKARDHTDRFGGCCRFSFFCILFPGIPCLHKLPLKHMGSLVGCAVCLRRPDMETSASKSLLVADICVHQMLSSQFLSVVGFFVCRASLVCCRLVKRSELVGQVARFAVLLALLNAIVSELNCGRHGLLHQQVYKQPLTPLLMGPLTRR